MSMAKDSDSRDTEAAAIQPESGCATNGDMLSTSAPTWTPQTTRRREE